MPQPVSRASRCFSYEQALKGAATLRNWWPGLIPHLTWKWNRNQRELLIDRQNILKLQNEKATNPKNDLAVWAHCVFGGVNPVDTKTVLRNKRTQHCEHHAVNNQSSLHTWIKIWGHERDKIKSKFTWHLIAFSTTANALIEKNLRPAFRQVRLSCNLLGITLLKCNQIYLVLTYGFALDTRRQFSLQIELYFFANKLLQFGDSSIQKRISCSYLSVCLEFPDLVQLLRIGWKGKHEQI